MGAGQPQQPTAATEGQTYCLRWNNHKSNLVEILDALIKGESYVDCTIVVDDQVQFKAHRVILAANSPYFQSILRDIPMDHCSIIFPGVKEFEMRALLEYMYTGEVNVTQSQIPKIMRIAEELEVKGLFDMADLKEKFNKLDEDHVERSPNINPYTTSTIPPPIPSYASAATSSSTAPISEQNGNRDPVDSHHRHTQHQHNSQSMISTSTHVSPSSIAPSSSSSPPYSGYKAYPNLYTKPSSVATTSAPPATSHTQSSINNVPTVTNTQTSQPMNAEQQSKWQLPTTAAAAAVMLSSVYDTAGDMNPLKRKKLSSISSMLMNRDTPILRNVLAQPNPADSSQPMPLLLPGTPKTEKTITDKNTTSHTPLVGSGHNKSHSFNGSDFGGDKYLDEPHSPFTDRSFEDEPFDSKGNFSGNFGSNANQKPEWKRYKQYTRNDIMSAIQCVRDGMTALQASRKFGVPSRTLYDKVKKLGITTSRPMNRTMKRSPSAVESSPVFPYSHAYGQSEPLMSSMHERGERDERGEPKEHLRGGSGGSGNGGGGGGGGGGGEHHHMAQAMTHTAAALLDPAFFQQALENHGGEIAGREALHAMALAAAAHAAANRIPTASPGPNGNVAARSPSPNYGGIKYSRASEHELMMEHEKSHQQLLKNERENDADDEDDHVEDLSIARKESISPEPLRRMEPSSYSTPPPDMRSRTSGAESENVGSGVIVPPISSKVQLPPPVHSNSSNDGYTSEGSIKRELIIDDSRVD